MHRSAYFALHFASTFINQVHDFFHHFFPLSEYLFPYYDVMVCVLATTKSSQTFMFAFCWRISIVVWGNTLTRE
jgi:hypothetical protein